MNKRFTPALILQKLRFSRAKRTGELVQGFTLIELIVSFTIIGLVTTIAFVNFRSSEETLALERSIQKISQDVRRTAELALYTDRSFSCASPRTPSGFGIFFDHTPGVNTSYIIYGNCDQKTDKKPGYDGGVQDRIIEEIPLEDAVQIQMVDGTRKSSGQPLNKESWSALFVPPDPQVLLCVNDSCSGNNELLGGASVTLSLKNDPSQTKRIEVNEAGFVDID